MFDSSVCQLQYFVTTCCIKSIPPPQIVPSCAVTLYEYAENKCYFKEKKKNPEAEILLFPRRHEGRRSYFSRQLDKTIDVEPQSKTTYYLNDINIFNIQIFI